MNIAVNALAAENRSGTGRYVTELLLALARMDLPCSFHVCLPRGSRLEEGLLGHPSFHLTSLSLKRRSQRIIWESRSLPRWIEERGAKLFWGPAFLAPAHCPVPAVVTVHDLIYELFPQTFPFLQRSYYQYAIPRSIRKAAAILVDSEATSRDLRRRYPDAGPVQVVPLGVDTRFFSPSTEEQIDGIRKKLALPDRYALTLGTREPRKNLEGLLWAYARFAAQNGQAPALVIAGRKGWGPDLAQSVLSPELEGQVYFPGFIEEADLVPLYQGADFFALASLYEGFGLPLVEALAAGLPVASSPGGALKEIGGETVFYGDPQRPDCLAEAMHQAWMASGKKATAEKGRQEAHRFSWDRCAQETLNFLLASV